MNQSVTPSPGSFVPDTSIELRSTRHWPVGPRHAIFDFDGTLSLVREGWMDIMVPMMVDILAQTGTEETSDELTTIVKEFVGELNGKQTIYQMIRLDEEVQRRGGPPREPLEYKHQYHDLLMKQIESRRAGLADGSLTPEDCLVPGAMSFLKALQQVDVTLYLASGTDVAYVREEAALLQVDRFFDGRIFGALDDFEKFSKAMVIENILKEHDVSGDDLVGFGDGYVEIQNVGAVGGLAVAVASDETNRSGRVDHWKRTRLIEVGAEVVVPDFQDGPSLVDLIWGSSRDATSK